MQTLTTISYIAKYFLKKISDLMKKITKSPLRYVDGLLSYGLIWTETEQSPALMSTKAQPCCWRVAPQQSPFPRPAALQNYKIFVIQRNYEIKSLNLHRHLRSTGLSDLASDTLS